MKNLLALLMVFAVIGTASAAPVNNGDFEDPLGPAAFWEAAGGGTWSAGEETTGGNLGGYITLECASGDWSIWYQSVNEDLNVVGITSDSETVTVSGDLKQLK